MKATGDELNKCACAASSTAVRMYNIIREVGYGKLTADNALHQLIEDVKNIRDLSDRLLKMSDSIVNRGCEEHPRFERPPVEYV